MTSRRTEQGFTLLEMIISVAIIGVLAAAFAPSILNPTDVRSIEAEARTIMSAFQSAKWQAASAKVGHRVRFFTQGGRWWHVIEVETAAGVWTGKPGQPARSVATKYALTLTLPPDSSVVFDPTGFVSGYDSARSTVALSSAKLASLGQPDVRAIRIFASGSLRLSRESGA
jgi:prepilin-type N-terminal cleavage/methylation domain-containing protein